MQLHAQLVTGLHNQRQTGFHGSRNSGMQVDEFASHLNLAAGHARKVQQVVDQVHHLFRLALDDFASACGTCGMVGAQAHQLQAGENGRKRISQLVREHCQKLALATIRLGQISRQLPQFLVDPVPIGAVGEKHAQLMVLWIANRKRIRVKPAPKRIGIAFEARRLAGANDGSELLRPERLYGRNQLAQCLAHHIFEPRLSFKGRTGFDVAKVNRHSVGIEKNLYDAKTRVHSQKKSPVSFLRTPQFFLCAFKGINLMHDQNPSGDAVLGITDRHSSDFCPHLAPIILRVESLDSWNHALTTRSPCSREIVGRNRTAIGFEQSPTPLAYRVIRGQQQGGHVAMHEMVCQLHGTRSVNNAHAHWQAVEHR